MRARWLKPEFFTDRKIAAMGAVPALVFQALWCVADDGGTALCDTDRLKGEMFFAWDSIGVPELEEALMTLSQTGRIRRYKVGDDTYCTIVHFERHQKVYHPSKFRHPPAPQQDSAPASADRPSSTETLGSPPESLGSPHILDTKTPKHQDTSKRSAEKLPPDKRVDEVLAHYRERHPMRRSGSAKDRSTIAHALKQYDADELKAAIDGNASDPWHTQRSMHALGYVLRDSGKIDTFIGLASGGPATSPTNRGRSLTAGERTFANAMRVLGTTTPDNIKLVAND
jgi:hypothetical protein